MAVAGYATGQMRLITFAANTSLRLKDSNMPSNRLKLLAGWASGFKAQIFRSKSMFTAAQARIFAVKKPL
jgi:hypothetical protein